LDLIILEVFSNLNDSMIHYKRIFPLIQHFSNRPQWFLNSIFALLTQAVNIRQRDCSRFQPYDI